MIAQDSNVQKTDNVSEHPAKNSKAKITPHQLNDKFSQVGEELNDILSAYCGLGWLAIDSEVDFKHAYFVIDSINKRLETVVNVFWDCKAQINK
jgi:hypothetical protein